MLSPEPAKSALARASKLPTMQIVELVPILLRYVGEIFARRFDVQGILLNWFS